MVLKGNGTHLLVEDCCKNSKECHAEDEAENELAAEGKPGTPYHGNWNCNESNVRCDIERHLENAVVLISRALEVLDWHSPVLAERTTEDAVVCDLNDNKSQSNVS